MRARLEFRPPVASGAGGAARWARMWSMAGSRLVARSGGSRFPGGCGPRRVAPTSARAAQPSSLPALLANLHASTIAQMPRGQQAVLGARTAG
jgi:hypothetical protein